MTRKTTIPIYDGDDFERMADLRRKVDIAERALERREIEARKASAPLRIGDLAPDHVGEARAALQQAEDEFDAFVDEASDRAELWVLTPIGHEEFRELLKDHPAREVDGEDGKKVTHPDDDGWGVNTESFPKALLTFVDPDDDEIRTVMSPEFDSHAALRKRIKRLSGGEFDSIWTAAYLLNTGGIGDPKAGKFSPGTSTSSAT